MRKSKYVLYLTMQELSRWLTGTEELFYRVPLPGRPRLQTCPACRDSGDGPSKMSAGHVFGNCSAIESARSRLKIRGFITEYEAIGNEDISPFAAFLSGIDKYGTEIDAVAHRNRGKALVDLRESWKTCWCTSREGKKYGWL